VWTDELKINPLGILLSSINPALVYLVERDILGQEPGAIETLWGLPEPLQILKKQRVEVPGLYPGNRPGDEYGENYELLETWKILRVLVEMYGLNRKHPAIQRAAEFIFSCQTGEGDIRGILSNQYMPYYVGAIMEVLIKAGYAQDERIIKGLEWLLSMRQQDGGWIIPLQMYKMQECYRVFNLAPIQPEKECPFSHMASGMVIRAFAAHENYRKSAPAIQAGKLLKSRFFQKDCYTSRQSVDYWFKFQFPFWWTNLLTVMDSLMRMDFPAEDADISKGVDWFIQHQESSGAWQASYGKSQHYDSDLWITYAICRVLKYFLK